MMKDGQGNLNIIGQCKEKVLRAILSDEDIMKLILNTPDVTTPALSARYDQVVPWRLVPDSQTDEKVYVTFEIAIDSFVKGPVRNHKLLVYVMCHSRLMKIDETEGKRLGIDDRGSRVDILADKIDYLLNGKTDLGFEKLEIDYSNPFEPIDNYYGRNMVYTFKSWNRYGDQMWGR